MYMFSVKMCFGNAVKILLHDSIYAAQLCVVIAISSFTIWYTILSVFTHVSVHCEHNVKWSGLHLNVCE